MTLPFALADRGADDPADAVQDRRVVGPGRVDERRRAFDVAQEEGDGVGCGAHVERESRGLRL